MNPANTGFYSLVQYCPDRSRLEAANFGVVLLCPALGFLGIRIAPNNERIRRFFGDEAGDLAQLNAMKKMLVRRVNDDVDLRQPEAFEKFRRVLSNELQISEPRPVRVEDPHAELAQLFSELVEAKEHGEPLLPPASFERLDEILSSAPFEKLIRRDVRIHIPVLDKELTVPYSYQNGRLNLIQTHRFAQKTEASMLQDAFKTAVQGHLLFKNPLPDAGECRLVVVGSFRNATPEIRHRVADVLTQHEIDFFEDNQIDDLAERILTTAH
ncbi:MAG: DUF3037 domain-containing protein [Luteolibacter sp.]